MKQTIITITGPSCSGKSTLAKYLSCNGIPEVLSFTTRRKREGESDIGVGRAYDFLTHEEVSAIDTKELIELVEFKGNSYGNTIRQMNEALTRGKGVATVVVEPNGVTHWKAFAESSGLVDVFSIYLQNDVRTLMSRFADRLKNARPEQMEYEMERLDNMIKVEHPTWREKHAYDLVLNNLDVGFTETREQVKGFIRYQFQRG